MYLWLKAFHIIFMVCWFAGLFYLPRLFVHHAMSEEDVTRERLAIMEGKLYRFVTPFMALTLIFGGGAPPKMRVRARAGCTPSLAWSSCS